MQNNLYQFFINIILHMKILKVFIYSIAKIKSVDKIDIDPIDIRPFPVFLTSATLGLRNKIIIF